VIAVESDLKLINIRLLNYHLDAVLPSELEGQKPVPDHGTPEIDFEIAKDDENGVYRIVLDLRSVAETAGYSYSIRAAGFFSVSDSIDDENRERLVLYSALPMLIGTLRGYLSDMTAHSVYGRYLLPSVDLARLLAEWQAQDEGAEQR